MKKFIFTLLTATSAISPSFANDFNPEAIDRESHLEENVLKDALMDAYSLEHATNLALQVRLSLLELLRMDLAGSRFIKEGIDKNITHDMGRGAANVGLYSVTIAANIGALYMLALDLAATPAAVRRNWVHARTVYTDTLDGRIKDRYGGVIEESKDKTSIGRASRMPKAMVKSSLQFALKSFVGRTLVLTLEAGIVAAASFSNLALWMTAEQFDNYIARVDKEINEIELVILQRSQNIKSTQDVDL